MVPITDDDYWPATHDSANAVDLAPVVREVMSDDSDARNGYVGPNEVLHIYWRIEEGKWWLPPSILISATDPRYLLPEDSGCRYYAQTLKQTLICGTLGFGLLIGQFWMPALDNLLGSPLGSNVGWLRLVMMFVGGFLGMAAAPSYRYSEDPKDLRT